MSNPDTDSYAAAYSKALNQCANADTTIMTCFPTNETRVYQGQFVDLVWNPRYPQFAQSGQVDIHLFRDIGDIQPSVYEAINITNPEAGNAGVRHIQVDDSWFDAEWDGIDLNDPFYFAIAPSGTVPQAQATFRAVQTGPVPLSSSTPAVPVVSSTSSPGTVNVDSSVPAGAIAGPVVGGLALISGLGAWYLLRRRRRAAARKAIVVNLGSDTNSDTHSIMSEADEKILVREMSRV
ncbi:unnamed protein product [Peniophora sp. CBMAI 1063]|nr:unnamed protein product [Peniophora sp. CBMAI 1063]